VASPSADLRIAKSSATTGTVSPGENFDYTLTVVNAGPSDATDVVVTDQLPTSVSFFSSADGCTGTVGALGGTVTCPTRPVLSAVPGSNTVSSHIPATLAAAYVGDGSDVPNTATVSSATADPVPANNSAQLTGIPSLAEGEAGMTVTKAVVGSPSVAPGETFSYTITVTNEGPSAAVNPRAVDTLGDDLEYVSGPSGCGVVGQTLTCPTGGLGLVRLVTAQSRTFEIVVRVVSDYAGDGSDLT